MFEKKISKLQEEVNRLLDEKLTQETIKESRDLILDVVEAFEKFADDIGEKIIENKIELVKAKLFNLWRLVISTSVLISKLNQRYESFQSFNENLANIAEKQNYEKARARAEGIANELIPLLKNRSEKEYKKFTQVSEGIIKLINMVSTL